MALTGTLHCDIAHLTNDGFFDNRVNYRVPSKDKQLVIAALGFFEDGFSFVGSWLEYLGFQMSLMCAPAESAFFPGNSE